MVSSPAPGTAARGDLSVRSVVLSVLLGAHPEALPSRQLVTVGAHFGLPEAGVRVALTRAVGAGDLRRVAAGYALGDRLVERQRRQQQALRPIVRPWEGGWETAYVVSTGRPAAQRHALRQVLGDHRLAELREGVWLRPDNLARPTSYAAHPDLVVCRSRFEDPGRTARSLWPLDDWATTGDHIRRRLGPGDRPMARLAAAGDLVRHLTTDPVLPAALLPDDWPGDALRRAYEAYQGELRALVGDAA